MPTSSIFLDPKVKEAIRINKAEVSNLLLDKQEKLQKKKEELAAGPLGVANVIADVGIGVLTLGNPILGTALKMGKDALTDPYLS